jgi:hypothetical protein
MSIHNRPLLAYIAVPTPKNWAELMRAIFPFDPSIDYPHGTLVTVGNELFRLESAPRGPRARRFNRAGKRFIRNSVSLAHFKMYVRQNPPKKAVLKTVPEVENV